MKKRTLLLFMMVLSAFYPQIKAQTINTSSTITWIFDGGSDGQTATYSGSTADYFNAEEATVGSNYSFNGTEQWRGPDGVYVDPTFTKILSASKSYDNPSEANMVSFIVKPKAELAFSPTTISFELARFGTGGGVFYVYWKSPDGTRTEIAGDFKANRSKDTETDPTQMSIDVSGLSIPTDVGDCTLEFNITELDPGKNIGIANVVIEGTLSGDLAALETYTITTSVSDENAGSISSSPAGTEFDEGTEIELTATSEFGYSFAHWEDAVGTEISTDNPLTFTIDKDTNIVAVFDVVETFELTATIAEGTLTISPEATDVDGKMMYETGTEITLSANPAFGYDFEKWENASALELSTSNPVTFTISSDTTFIAVIAEDVTYILPSWTFDNEYDKTVSNDTSFYNPAIAAASNHISGTDAWIYPNNDTYGDSVGLTGSTSSFSTNTTASREVCRIMWNGANEVSDYADGSTHTNYYQFKFSTSGFTNIGLDFTFSGGQNDDTDSLAVVYSVDGGATWTYNGAHNAASHWGTFVNYTPSLPAVETNPSADNQELVIVRLIGVVTSTGDNRNFNLDEFTVTGIKTYSSEFHTITYSASPDVWGSVSASEEGFSFIDGTEITLTATPTYSYTKFEGWQDAEGNLVSSTNPLTVTLTSDTVLVALFGIPTEVKDPTATEIAVVTVNDNIQVQNLEDVKGTISVYDINGRELSQRSITSSVETFAVANQGIYLVKIHDTVANEIHVVKALVRF